MSPVRPVKPDHSINEVVFVLNFSKPFSEKELESLIQLEGFLKDDLPKMELHKGGGFSLSPDGKMEALSPKLVSLSFKHYNEKDTFNWALRAEGNFIAVNCLDYSDGCNEIWPKVHNYINHVTQKLVSTELSVESLTLQYIDRFIYEGQIDCYEASTIFDDHSEYLNKKVTKVGPYWHIHQGWFDTIKELPVRILNVLNITAALADKEHHTTIDHSATIQFKQKITNHKTLFEDTIKGMITIDYYFDLLHEENKQVLRGLLNSDRIDDIKLKQN